MALNDVITSIQNHTREIYEALSSKNATIPTQKNLANVPAAIISIPVGENTGDTDVKIFNSITEMNASTENEAGDLAVVYKESTGHLEGNDVITAWTFPTTVVLDEAYTGGSASGLYWFDPFISDSYYCTLTPTSARFEMNGSGIVFNARYTSTDGITYTLVSGGGDVVLPEGITMSLARDSIDTNGSVYHFFAEPQYVELEKMLEGIYEYTSANKWELLILSTSNATATAENIEKDKTAYVNGELITGTLNTVNSSTTRADSVRFTDWGEEPGLEAIVNTENPIIVKEGYGIFTPERTIAKIYAVTPNQIVTGNIILGVEGTATLAGIDTSDATASEFDIAEGQTAYVNGEKITGTLPYVTDVAQVGAINYQSYNGLFEGSINADGIISGGMDVQFYASDIASVIELTPDQITAGNTILGIAGTGSDEGIDTSDATATASDIMYGKTAYVNGEKITGSIANTSYDNMSETEDIQVTLNQNSFYMNGEPYVSFYNANTSGLIYQTIRFNKSAASVADAIGLTANKIVSGNTILGIEGTATAGGGIDTSDATAYDWHLPTGVTAYARGEKITGTMPIHSDTRYIYNNAGFINDDFVLYAQTNPNDYTLFGVGVDIGIQIEPENLAAAINLTADKLIQGSTVLGVEGIAATNGIDTSAATATENDLALGKTAYVNGQLIEGTLYDMLEGDWIAWTNIRNTYERGTLTLYSAIDGDMIVRTNSEIGSSITDSEMATLFGVTADKIVSGNTILGVTGTATGGLDTSDATAAASDIVKGKTAYVNGQKITGTINYLAGGTAAYSTSTIREGSYNTLYFRYTFGEDYLFRTNKNIELAVDYEDLADAIGLTPNIIAQGNTILGIEGTATTLAEYAPKYISFQGYTGTDLSSETSALNTSNITDMSEMFKDCSNLTELDLDNFDTSNVTDMSNMFSGCSDLEILDMSSFDVSNVSTATGMFDNIPSDCIIWVKDEATREWVLSIRSDLINVLVTGEALPSATNPTLTSVSKDYDGSSLAITVTGGSGGTIYYRTSEDNSTWSSWTTVIPNRTEIGVTYVQAYVKGDNTHSDTLPTASATITINEVPKTSIAIPTGKTNLKYTGSAQTGVAAGTGYTLSGTTSATNAGTYTAYATPDLNYIWSDGTSAKKTITWSIAKATPTISIDQGWAPDVIVGNSETLGLKPSVSGTWSISSSSSALSLTSKPSTATAGSYSYLTYKGVSEKSSVTITVTLNPSSTTNYNSVTETYKVSVDGIYPDDLTVVTTGRTTYTANEIGGSSFKLDGYTFRVDYNNGTSKNVSSSQCTYGYTWSPGKSSVPVTVYYEENGETVTTSVTITINPSS